MTLFLLLAALVLFAVLAGAYGVDSRTYPDGVWRDRPDPQRAGRTHLA